MMMISAHAGMAGDEAGARGHVISAQGRVCVFCVREGRACIKWRPCRTLRALPLSYVWAGFVCSVQACIVCLDCAVCACCLRSERMSLPGHCAVAAVLDRGPANPRPPPAPAPVPASPVGVGRPVVADWRAQGTARFGRRGAYVSGGEFPFEDVSHRALIVFIRSRALARRRTLPPFHRRAPSRRHVRLVEHPRALLPALPASRSLSLHADTCMSR